MNYSDEQTRTFGWNLLVEPYDYAYQIVFSAFGSASDLDLLEQKIQFGNFLSKKGSNNNALERKLVQAKSLAEFIQLLREEKDIMSRLIFKKAAPQRSSISNLGKGWIRLTFSIGYAGGLSDSYKIDSQFRDLPKDLDDLLILSEFLRKVLDILEKHIRENIDSSA